MSLMTSWPDDDDLEEETLESLETHQNNKTADESMLNDEFLQEAIREHALFLGMDPDVDQDYMWIAEEALTAPLPEGWQQAEAEDGTPYHFNPDTGESLWEHPLDEVYREKFRNAKANGTKQPKAANTANTANTASSSTTATSITTTTIDVHGETDLSYDARAREDAAAEKRRKRLEQEEQEAQEKQLQQQQQKERERKERAQQERAQQDREQQERERDKRDRDDAQRRREEREALEKAAAAKDDWLNEIEELSTLGKNITTTTTTTTTITAPDDDNSVIGGDWDNDGDDDDNDNDGNATSSKVNPRSVRSTSVIMSDATAKADAARVAAAEAHAAATTENAHLLRTKDAKISELRKRLSDQRSEYEEILAEQKDILLQNESAMNELTDLHSLEVRELTEQITKTRNGSQAVNEAHTLDVQRLQTEITNLRNENNQTSEEVLQLQSVLNNKEEELNTRAAELEECESKILEKERTIAASVSKVEELNRKVVEATRGTETFEDNMSAVQTTLKKSEAKNAVLQRAKAALSDEIRKLVSEKDTLQMTLNSALGERDDLKKRNEQQIEINKKLTLNISANETKANEHEKRRLEEQKRMEETRLNELRKSFEARCAQLIEERTKSAEKYDDQIHELTTSLSDVKTRASAVIMDSEEAKIETKTKLLELAEERDRAIEKASSLQDTCDTRERDVESREVLLGTSRKRLVELERNVQELTEKANSDSQGKQLAQLNLTLKRRQEELETSTKEVKQLRSEQPKMQDAFSEAIKEAMERAAGEATADAEGQWRARIEDVRAEYLTREKQLTADAGAARSRLREASDRLIELERHTAQATATLDVVKRENVSLQSSLDHARNELTSGRIRTQQQQQQQHYSGSASVIAPQAAYQHYGNTTSFYAPQAVPQAPSQSHMMGVPPPSSMEDSRRILAIQNQVRHHHKHHE